LQKLNKIMKTRNQHILETKQGKVVVIKTTKGLGFNIQNSMKSSKFLDFKDDNENLLNRIKESENSMNWTLEPGDKKFITAIADKFLALVKKENFPDKYAKQDIILDIATVHLNCMKLRLQEFAETEDGFYLAHDILGIKNSLNKKTGQFEGDILLKFAIPNFIPKKSV